MDREGSIELIDAVVVARGADGKVRFGETANPSGRKWAKRGAVVGGSTPSARVAHRTSDRSASDG
jgi:uncharacterized membrane protein